MAFAIENIRIQDTHSWTARYVSAAIVFLYILLFASSAAKPLHLDNADLPYIAKQTAISGVPVYYDGEEIPTAIGLYHPPLYLYLLTLWIRIFGFGEAQVRLFGMTCALLQGAVVLGIVRTLFGSVLASRWQPFFWAIFLLNPYTLQAASIADIDSTIYGPLLCFVLLSTLRISWRNGEWRTDPVSRWEYALVGLAVFLCLWSKLTTILLVFPTLPLLLISRTGIRRAVLATAAVVGGSIIAFLASYYAYGRLVGIDVGLTFGFTWMSFVQRGSSGTPGLVARLEDYWRNLRFMIPFMASWTGLLPWVAACSAVGVALLSGLRDGNRRLLHYGITLGLGVLSTGYYCAKVSTFGFAPFKYVFVYWGLVLTAPLFLLTPEGIFSQRIGNGWKTRVSLFLLYGAAAVWGMLRVRDALMLDGFVGPYRLAACVPALLFIVALAGRRYGKAWHVGAIGAVALYCGLQFGIATYQERAPYATTYDYGQRGFWDTVAFLKSNTRPNDVIASMKDIGFRSGLRYFETYGALYGDSASEGRFKEQAAAGRFAYIVFTEGRGQDQLVVNPSLRQWVLDHVTLVRSFGNYRIYQINSIRQHP